MSLILAVALVAVATPATAFHYPWDQGHDPCRPGAPLPPPPDCDKCDATGSPFVVATGAYRTASQDLLVRGPMPLELTRIYHGRDLYNGMFGRGWTFTYGVRLIEVTDGVSDHAIIRRANGQRDRFLALGGGQFTAPADVREVLTRNPDESFDLVTREKERLRFDASGRLVGWSDLNGNSLTLAYDAVGFLESVTDDSGRSLSFTKGANGKVAAVSDPANRTVTYDYDSDGNLIRATDAAGGTTEYSYDAAGNLTSIVDPRGFQVAAITYDSEGRVRTYSDQAETYTLTHQPSASRVIETDSSGNTRTFIYNDNINVVSRTDRAGETETTTFDASFNVAAVTDRNGNTTSFTHDAFGNRLSMTEPTDDTTTYGFDANSNSLSSVTDPLGNQTTFEYDARGNVIRTVDAAGNETLSTYDSRGLLVSTTDANGFVRTFTHDASGYLTQETDSLGRVSLFTYDAVGNLTSAVDPDGTTWQLAYDALNRLVEIEDSAGNKTGFEWAPRCLACEDPDLLTAIVEHGGARTTFEHDQFGRVTRVTDPLGNSFDASYDARGNPLTITNARAQTTTYLYDALDRLTRVTRPGGVVTSYTYDANGNVTSITDPGGQTTGYTYDSLNRLHSIASPDAGTVQFTYDAAGRRSSKSDARGVVSSYEYDGLGRRTAIRFPDASQEATFRYDEAVAGGKGRLTGMADPTGDTTLAYDEHGRLIELGTTRFGTSYLTRYEYSAAGSAEKLVYPSGLEISYGLDAAGLVASVVARIGGADQTIVGSATYDADGNRLSTAFGNSLTETRTYDLNGRVTEVATAGVQQLRYSYDEVGNVLSVVDAIDTARNQAYSYDALDRLVGATGPWEARSYSYDATGNRIQTTRGAAVFDYVYDANRLDQISGAANADYTFDAAGNTTFDGRFDYEYGQNGRLSRVLESGAEIARFRHNGFGQRVIKEAGGDTTVYHYDNQKRLIEETAADGTSIRAYTYLPDGNPLALIEGGQVYFYHLDRLGTPLKLTDGSGSEVWSADVTPFGEFVNVTGSIEQPLRFPGQYHDVETGLHYNYHREYDPKIGRYLQPDPLGLQAGINLYAYAGNNPLRFTDPNGLVSLFQAVKHYFFGKGKTLKVPFGDVDQGLGPRDFPGFLSAVMSMYKKKGTKKVSLSVSKDVGDLVYGHVTFRLTGTITSDKCKWSFNGKVEALNDTFDFNALPWGVRKRWKEVITRLFGTLPGGTPFQFDFTGSRSVAEKGKW